MKIGIIGTRSRDTEEDFKLVYQAFYPYLIKNNILMKEIFIVSGGCSQGGDRFAEIIARRLHIVPIIHYPIEPCKKNKWSYAKACFARNTLVARDSDMLIACVRPPLDIDDVLNRTKGGTEDTIKKFINMFKHSKEEVVLV